MIRNYIELAVEEMLDEVISKYKEKNPDICNCPRCRLDVI